MIRLVVATACSLVMSGPLHAYECKFQTNEQQQRCLAELSTVQVFMTVQTTVPGPVQGSSREIRFESKGSGFVFDGIRNLIVTAKHVIIGERVWRPDLEDTKFSNSIDTHSAIEQFVRKFGKLEIRTEKGLPRIEAELVALDPSSDIAILRFGGKTTVLDSRVGAPFRNVRFARGCLNGMNIFGAGYPDSLDGDFDRTGWRQIEDCRLVPISYIEGLPWFSALLYRSNAEFEAGMSGGPVIDGGGRIIGMVAGSTANGKRGFIVPVGAIRRAISRIGIDSDLDE